MGRIFGLTIFLFGLVIVVFLYRELAPFWSKDKNGMIYYLWKQDIEKLLLYQKIPKEWQNIKTIEYIPLSDSAKTLLEKVKAPIRTHTDGEYTLQIGVDDWQDKEYLNLLVQYHLIDSKTGNTVWELDRNLKVKAETALQNTSVSGTPQPDVSPSASPKPQAPRQSNPSRKRPSPSRTHR